MAFKINFNQDGIKTTLDLPQEIVDVFEAFRQSLAQPGPEGQPIYPDPDVPALLKRLLLDTADSLMDRFQPADVAAAQAAAVAQLRAAKKAIRDKAVVS